MNILYEKSNLTRLIQSHKGYTPFDYNICIDWAIELMENNLVTDNISIIAGFSKPVNSWEIKDYVSRVLKEFNLEEFNNEKAFRSISFYYVWNILNDVGNIISHLEKLCSLCINNDYEDNIFPFYLLKYSWEDLRDLGFSCHYEGVTLENFNDVVKNEAEIWMKNFNNL